MVKFCLINTSYLTALHHFNSSSGFVETRSTTISSFVLFSLLLVSLGLTFHSKGTTVHKVLGLLLTSVFTVFLWMFQSQFLFIYVVYILAFISAVLMLFLSVVLMLPISTLTAKNTLTDQSNKFNFMMITFSTETITTSVISSCFIVFMCYLFYFCNNLPAINISEMHNMLVEYSKWYFKINNQVSNKNFIYQKVTNKQNSSIFNTEALFSNTSKILNLKANSFYYFYLNVGHSMWLSILNGKNKGNKLSSTFHNINLCALLLWTLVTLIVQLAFKASFLKMVVLQSYLRLGMQFIKSVTSLPHNTMKLLCDVVIQSYLFTTITLGMAFLFFSKQTILTNTASVLNNESLQGLGQIKALLYGEFSLFLVFSTLVLLIALLGAAIMTRSKR